MGHYNADPNLRFALFHPSSKLRPHNHPCPAGKDGLIKRRLLVRAHGYIAPGSAPNPVVVPAEVTGDVVTVMLGDNVGVFMRKDQSYIFANMGTPIVSVGFGKKGGRP